LAFAMGWFTHWLLHRFARVAVNDLAEMDRMAHALHEAEEVRDQAVIYLEQREGELMNHSSQTEAELRAAMDGLRDALQEAETMRDHIERMHANGCLRRRDASSPQGCAAPTGPKRGTELD